MMHLNLTWKNTHMCVYTFYLCRYAYTLSDKIVCVCVCGPAQTLSGEEHNHLEMTIAVGKNSRGVIGKHTSHYGALWDCLLSRCTRSTFTVEIHSCFYASLC